MPHQLLAFNQKRWLAFFLCVLCYMLAQYHRILPSSMGGAWQHSFNISQESLGWLASMYFYVYTVMQIPTGLLVDKYGSKWLITLGAGLAGLGALLMSVSPYYALVLLGRVVLSFGVAGLFIAMLKLIAVHFAPRHFATLTGLGIMLGNVGAILATAPTVWALSVYDWRFILLALGLISLCLACVCMIWLPNQPALHRPMNHAPQKVGVWQGVVQVLRNPYTYGPLGVCACVAGSYLCFVGMWSVPFLQATQQMTKSMAAAHNMWALIGFSLGSLVLGRVSDFMRRRKGVMMMASFIFVLCWLPLLLGWRLQGVWGYALFMLMGLSVSGFTLTWALVKELNASVLSGTATSMVNAGAFLLTALLQPFLGWILDQHLDNKPYGYTIALIVLLGVASLGMLFTFYCKESYAQQLA